MMKYLIHCLLISSLMMFGLAQANAEVIVIANEDSNISKLSKSQLKRIYLGKMKRIAGKKIKLADLASGASRKEFYQKVVRKNESQLKAYWSKLIFSGRGTPPKQIQNEKAMREWVAQTPNAIGYVSAADKASGVIVIGRF